MTEKHIPEINVGVVGHIDHGKTTLLSRLTGKFADTHSEELKRGITIKLGYASITVYKTKTGYTIADEKGATPERYVSFIDAPGHEMLMATMLSGAATIDAAMLVIAANEGIKPQTKEHLMALEAKKIPQIIIVQNKIDLVNKDQAKESYTKIKEFVKGTIAKDAPIIPLSAQQSVNIDKLLEALMELKIPHRNEKAEPFFMIARSFDINRPGTEIKKLKGAVVGGILKEGTLNVGDKIEIKPGLAIKKGNDYVYEPLETSVVSLQKGTESVKSIGPGASIAIETNLDPLLAKTDSLTGCILSRKGALPEISSTLTLKAQHFKKSFDEKEHAVDNFKTKETLMLSVNTTITVGVVEKIKEDELTLNLSIPIVARSGDNVGIARNMDGHWRLIGVGEVQSGR